MTRNRRNRNEELSKMLNELVGDFRVSEMTSTHGADIVAICYRDRSVAELWRWDAEDGFIYCGEA